MHMFCNFDAADERLENYRGVEVGGSIWCDKDGNGNEVTSQNTVYCGGGPLPESTDYFTVNE